MDPGGTLRLLLISTEEILSGGVFIANTCSEDSFYLFKSVREPLFSPLVVQMPSNSMEKKLAWLASGLMRAAWS